MKKKPLPVNFGEANRERIEYFAEEWNCSLSATVQRMVQEWRDVSCKPIEQINLIDYKSSEPKESTTYTQTFREWLYKHLKRDTQIGDLARDAKRDRDWKKDTVESLETRIWCATTAGIDTSDPMKVFKRAKKSYLKSQEKLAQTQ